MDTKIEEQLDYKKHLASYASYRMSKVLPQTGNANVILSTAGGQDSVFEIPVKVPNFAKSVMSFTLTPDATAAAYNYMAMDCLSPIDQLQLYTKQGVFLADLKYVPKMTKTMWKPEFKLDDFLALDNHDAGSGQGALLQKCNEDKRVLVSQTAVDYRSALSGITSAQIIAAGRAVAGDSIDFDGTGGASEGLMTVTRVSAEATSFDATVELDVGDVIVFTAGDFRNYNLVVKSITSATVFNVAGGAAIDMADAVITTNTFTIYKNPLANLVKQPSISARRHNDSAVAAGTGTLSAVDVSYQEPKYFSVGGYATATPVINVKINLGMLKGSFFAIDKDVLFDEIIYMRIVWAPTNKIVHNGTDPASPSAGAAQAANSITLSNLRLFLAVETNPEIINGLRAKIRSGGLKLQIPYTYGYRNAVAASADQNISLRFNRGHGARLQKIYHSVFHNTENSNTAYDHDNRAQAKVVSFYTQLDNWRQQEFDVSCANYEDYMLLKDKLKGSVLTTADMYKYNWFWCDCYIGELPLYQYDPNEVSGLSLEQERRWDFIATTANAAHNHYTFAVCQRELVIAPMGEITVS